MGLFQPRVIARAGAQREWRGSAQCGDTVPMVPKPTDAPADPHVEPRVGQAVDRALGRLRDKGHRVTTPRRVVIEALVRSEGHPSADELCVDIERRHPGVHRTTVYRTLEMLTDLGQVTHVHMGHGATAYHLAGSGADHGHLHARCQVCRRVFDLPEDLLEPIRSRLALDSDFLLDPRHVALSGTCRTCSERDA